MIGERGGDRRVRERVLRLTRPKEQTGEGDRYVRVVGLDHRGGIERSPRLLDPTHPAEERSELILNNRHPRVRMCNRPQLRDGRQVILVAGEDCRRSVGLHYPCLLIGFERLWLGVEKRNRGQIAEGGELVFLRRCDLGRWRHHLSLEQAIELRPEFNRS